MHEHIVPVDDEGVEGAVVDEVDADSLRAEAGGVEDGLGVKADQRFGFGVADEPGGVAEVEVMRAAASPPTKPARSRRGAELVRA